MSLILCKKYNNWTKSLSLQTTIPTSSKLFYAFFTLFMLIVWQAVIQVIMYSHSNERIYFEPNPVFYVRHVILNPLGHLSLTTSGSSNPLKKGSLDDTSSFNVGEIHTRKTLWNPLTLLTAVFCPSFEVHYLEEKAS